MQLHVSSLFTQLSERRKQHIIALQRPEVSQTAEAERPSLTRLTQSILKEIHVNRVRHRLPTIVLAEVAGNVLHQLLRHGNHQVGLLIGLPQQRNLPGITGRRTELLLKYQSRKVFRDDVWYMILPADQHGRIARPLRTMGVQHVGHPILGHIRVEHLTNNPHPSSDVPPDRHRYTPLERLAHRDALHLMLIAAVRQREIALRSDGDAQLHIAQDTHLVARGLQGSGLIQAELPAVGRKKRWYLEYVHELKMKK